VTPGHCSAERPLTRLPAVPQTSPAGNRQWPHRGGRHVRRTHDASARHQSPPRRPARQAHLLGLGPPRGLVPQVVRPAPRASTTCGQHAARPPAVGGKTPAQHRRGLRLQKLPKGFVAPTGRLPLALEHVTFIRRVNVSGTVTVLSQLFRVGKKHRGLYLRLVLDTGRGRLRRTSEGPGYPDVLHGPDQQICGRPQIA
jgi:hypothetical protein